MPSGPCRCCHGRQSTSRQGVRRHHGRGRNAGDQSRGKLHWHDSLAQVETKHIAGGRDYGSCSCQGRRCYSCRGLCRRICRRDHRSLRFGWYRPRAASRRRCPRSTQGPSISHQGNLRRERNCGGEDRDPPAAGRRGTGRSAQGETGGQRRVEGRYRLGQRRTLHHRLVARRRGGSGQRGGIRLVEPSGANGLLPQRLDPRWRTIS
mmetsp:Transcript_11334/g.18229  ORF Transcript_11334/g.18229 Transcript_11334/m.18229 type:complete len:206 (-) Transcript_11334:276-893(-)